MNDERVDAFRKLMDAYGHKPTDYDAGEEEDPRPYFTGEEELSRFVCVTVNYTSHGSAKYFFLPTFDEMPIAAARAFEYAHDDCFEELPVAVVDLDTGQVWEADWTSVDWIERNAVES